MADEITTINAEQLKAILSSKESKESRISKIEQTILKRVGNAKRVKFLIDKALELADGIYMIDDKDPEKIKYYKKAPDLDAIIYLIDRLVGKPTAKQEVKDTSNAKGVVTIQNMIMNLAATPVATPKPVKNLNNETNGKSNRSTITVSEQHVRVGADVVQE